MSRLFTGASTTLGAGEVREMFALALAHLESQVEAINALNVFPVPDGDTGINMALTMRDALAEAQRSEAEAGAGGVFEALARGALLGARGNSGVILSQILKGLNRGVQSEKDVGGPDLARAFQAASEAAYQAVGNPVEGTILTVIRAVAEAVRKEAHGDVAPATVMEDASSTAKAAVARTVLQLDVLREHGVVDAGGQGLSVLLEGMAAYLRGETATPELVPAGASAFMPTVEHGPGGIAYGFCTEFFIEGGEADAEQLRPGFESLGQSVLVVGDPGLVKVHLHTLELEEVLGFARSLGAVTRVKVDNIDHQHQDFSAKQSIVPMGEVGVVAVVVGDGLCQLFRSLGVAAIVPGGQSMNPSAEEMLRAAEGLPCPKVVLLPNNRNVVPAARQAGQLSTGKEIYVLPTEDLQQGVSAMMAFIYELDAKSNLAAMEEARKKVKTGELTLAVRETTVNGVRVGKGQPIGLSRGSLVVANPDMEITLERLLEHVGVEDDSAITLYYGMDVSAPQAEEVQRFVQVSFPRAEVDLFHGGQPHYHYLFSVE